MNLKTLGRTGLRLSPFGAGLGIAGPAGRLPAEVGVSNWCDLPVEVTPGEWEQAAGRMHGAAGLIASASAASEVWRPQVVQVRIGPDLWNQQMGAAMERVLACIGRSAVDLVQLAVFDLERIKAGEPFRRLQELRDSRRVRFFSVWADEWADARWVIENSPAHAVTVNAPWDAAGWRELFDLAAEADTGIIAGPAVAGGDAATARRLWAETPIVAFSWPVEVT